MVTNSRGESRYRGLTLGVRKRLSSGYQLEANYVLAKDEDDDSNERDPFTDRSFNFFDLDRTGARRIATSATSSTSSATSSIPRGFGLNTRVQDRGAQPITRQPAQSQRRRSRPQQRAQGQRVLHASTGGWRGRSGSARSYELTPILEMFNTFNNANNINPLTTPPLFDFDGFLRTGVGDPRQVQLAVKLTF